MEGEKLKNKLLEMGVGCLVEMLTPESSQLASAIYEQWATLKQAAANPSRLQLQITLEKTHEQLVRVTQQALDLHKQLLRVEDQLAEKQFREISSQQGKEDERCFKAERGLVQRLQKQVKQFTQHFNKVEVMLKGLNADDLLKCKRYRSFNQTRLTNYCSERVLKQRARAELVASEQKAQELRKGQQESIALEEEVAVAREKLANRRHKIALKESLLGDLLKGAQAEVRNQALGLQNCILAKEVEYLTAKTQAHRQLRRSKFAQ